MPSIPPPPTDSGKVPRREPSTEDQWAAVHAALKARDMPAVVALLHPLAVSDPHGVELFMAVVAASASPGPDGEAQ